MSSPPSVLIHFRALIRRVAPGDIDILAYNAQRLVITAACHDTAAHLGRLLRLAVSFKRPGGDSHKVENITVLTDQLAVRFIIHGVSSPFITSAGACESSGAVVSVWVCACFVSWSC